MKSYPVRRFFCLTILFVLACQTNKTIEKIEEVMEEIKRKFNFGRAVDAVSNYFSIYKKQLEIGNECLPQLAELFHQELEKRYFWLFWSVVYAVHYREYSSILCEYRCSCHTKTIALSFCPFTPVIAVSGYPVDLIDENMTKTFSVENIQFYSILTNSTIPHYKKRQPPAVFIAMGYFNATVAKVTYNEKNVCSNWEPHGLVKVCGAVTVPNVSYFYQEVDNDAKYIHHALLTSYSAKYPRQIYCSI